MKSGLLGGTFDPPHLGHLVIAEQAREQLALDRVLFVPAGQPWMKAGRQLSPAHHRLAMTRLAVEGHPAFEVSDVEIARRGPTYSVDTLEELLQREPHTELYFLLGQDALVELARWRQPERFLELCRVGVYPRLGAGEGDLGRLEQALPGVSRRVEFIEGPMVGISATDLRQRVAQGRSLRYLVPPAVEEYIRRHGLYTGGKSGDADQ